MQTREKPKYRETCDMHVEGHHDRPLFTGAFEVPFATKPVELIRIRQSEPLSTQFLAVNGVSGLER